MLLTLIKYFRHPWHWLELCHSEIPYECDGCHQRGFGPRYKCQNNCNFHIHEECSRPRLHESFFHQYFPSCNYKFYWSPPTSDGRYCQACGKNVHGYSFYCNLHGHYFHPVCANLPVRFTTYNWVEIKLCVEAPTECLKCRNRVISDFFKGWSYVFCGQYSYHLACLMDSMYDTWRHSHFSHDANRTTRDFVLLQAMNQSTMTPQNREAPRGSCGYHPQLGANYRTTRDFVLLQQAMNQSHIALQNRETPSGSYGIMTLLKYLELSIAFNFGPFSVSLNAPARG